ncbi:hypothetical protein YC2023_106228 [Brassica napus]
MAGGFDLTTVSVQVIVTYEYGRMFYNNTAQIMRDNLRLIQTYLLNSQSPLLAKVEYDAQQRLEILAKAELSFLYQRSRITWLREGGCNSCHFHLFINGHDGIEYVISRYKS